MQLLPGLRRNESTPVPCFVNFYFLKLRSRNQNSSFRKLLGRNRTLITFFEDEGAHTPARSKRRRAREVEMEVAALVIFSSVALWFAEELNGNTL
jgi:hypothetical protein